jgi:hypothetical protein
MFVQRVVVPTSRLESWTVIGQDGAPIESVERYLAYLTDVERSPNTVKKGKQKDLRKRDRAEAVLHRKDRHRQGAGDHDDQRREPPDRHHAHPECRHEQRRSDKGSSGTTPGGANRRPPSLPGLPQRNDHKPEGSGHHRLGRFRSQDVVSDLRPAATRSVTIWNGRRRSSA